MTTPIQLLVIADMHERMRIGMERYGKPLLPHNGRDGLQDLYEELLDACCYIKQVMVERDDPDKWYAREVARLKDRSPA